MFDEIKQPKKRAFLEAYIKTGNITEASRVAGVDRVTSWRWRKEDEQYAKAFEELKERIDNDRLDRYEVELDKRALGGESKQSDILLMFGLKSLDPNKYRER
ncbi:IS630 transposase-related protein, partial [Chloroflexota bacterium]